MKKSKTLVLFDVGGVLLELDYGKFYREAAKIASTDSKKFERSYYESNLEKSIMTGSINTIDYLDGLRKIISAEKNLSEQELRKIIRNCWEKPLKEVIDIKRKIAQKGYSVGIFSNTSELAFEMISAINSEIFEVYSSDAPKIFSFQIGSMKPQPQMYQQIRGYRKVIFIDDKESYLKTGIEQFNWKGILFTPFIDKAEALRLIHRDTTKPTKDFMVANSTSELISALRDFGVNLT